MRGKGGKARQLLHICVAGISHISISNRLLELIRMRCPHACMSLVKPEPSTATF